MAVPGLQQRMDVFDSYSALLSAIRDPQEKFNTFDQITSQELSSPAFEVLYRTGQDKDLRQICLSPTFTLGSMGSLYMVKILTATHRCKELSKEMIRSLDLSKSRLSLPCPQIDTYIDSKIFQALSRILLADNFANSSDRLHPLYSINLEMWRFQENNHGSICRCYNHIQANLGLKIEYPIDFLAKMTQVTVQCRVDPGDKLFIRGVGPGMNWDRGIELQKRGDDTWTFETTEDFPFLEYKILLNDNRWETGGNRRLTFGKKEAVEPHF